MNELLILRHGKSDWSKSDTDFYRPLKDRGKRNAQQMGCWLAQQGLTPDIIISSPAERALTTAEKASKAMGQDTSLIKTVQAVYAAGLGDLLHVLSKLPDKHHRVMLVGHNPGLEDLLLYLAKKELPRLTFVYFYLIALVLLIGYRSLLRFWYRVRRSVRQDITRIVVVGAGKVGQDLVEQFHRQRWSSLEIIGFLDDDPDKLERRIHGIPVIATVSDIRAAAEKVSADEALIAIPSATAAQMRRIVNFCDNSGVPYNR